MLLTRRVRSGFFIRVPKVPSLLRGLRPQHLCIVARPQYEALKMAQPAAVKLTRPESPLPAPVAGQKRKRPAEKKYYAVKVGKEPGVYETWDQCLAQVTGQKGAVCELDYETYDQTD